MVQIFLANFTPGHRTVDCLFDYAVFFSHRICGSTCYVDSLCSSARFVWPRKLK